MADPFHITGPAVISFSGGRTSGYMLWRILQSHDGRLPDDVVVCFANTGREMPATLDFVAECAARWGVHVHWLEFRARRRDGYEVVSHNSASREGEPFAALLAAQSALPNPVQRSCTQELKIRTMKRWVICELGWKRWLNVVGLRADEQHRVERVRKPTKERWAVATPLADAGVSKADVLNFWSAQAFDLRLLGPWEGNCDGCFLKSRAARMRLMRDYPARMNWWSEMESVPRGRPGVGRRFRKDQQTYAELMDEVARTPVLPLDETMHELGRNCDGGCGI